jgi:hypothetical protein
MRLNKLFPKKERVKDLVDGEIGDAGEHLQDFESDERFLFSNKREAVGSMKQSSHQTQQQITSTLSGVRDDLKKLMDYQEERHTIRSLSSLDILFKQVKREKEAMKLSKVDLL